MRKQNIFDPPDEAIYVIEAPDFFRGKELAAKIGDCLLHENAIEFMVLNKDIVTRKVCVKRDGYIVKVAG